MKFPSYGAAGVLTVCLLSTSALASSGGITGNSGKQNGMTCTTAGCHQTGASTPTVEFSGPTTLAPGETGQYSLIIRGGPAVVGGTNIAVSNTAAALEPVTGSGLRKASSELTHASPKSFSNGEVRFDFTMIAPSTGGTVTLYGAGNSANKNSANTGDGVATATQVVTITSGTGGGTDGGMGNGDGDGDEDDGGCSATGGAPMLMLALSALTLTRFRRRRS